MDSLSRIKYGKGCVFNLNYHLVWCPKCRKPVLVDKIAEDAKTIFKEIAQNIKISIETLEIMPDHVHLFVSAPPTVSPHVIVKRMKGATSKILRDKYPQLKRFAGCLWSSAYYAGSVGQMSESTVRLYIESQKGK